MNLNYFRGNNPVITGQIADMRLLVSTMLFLIIYATGAMEGILHLGDKAHFHGQESLQCDQRAETDPCHLSIFHSGRAECPHDAHLFAAVPDCNLCDLLPNFNVRDWVQVRSAGWLAARTVEFILPVLPNSTLNDGGILLRGPPAPV